MRTKFRHDTAYMVKSTNYRHDIKLRKYRHDIAYKVNSFVLSLNIPVTINILNEIIKILHDKMPNGIYWYWFYNGALEKNNSQNGHSN